VTTELLFYHKQRSISQAEPRNATQILGSRSCSLPPRTSAASGSLGPHTPWNGMLATPSSVAEDGTEPRRDPPRRPGSTGSATRPIVDGERSAVSPSWTHVSAHSSASGGDSRFVLATPNRRNLRRRASRVRHPSLF
jgi:hypothetical protein